MARASPSRGSGVNPSPDGDDDDIEVVLPPELQVIQRTRKHMLAKLQPTLLVPYLTCLTKSDEKHISAVERTEGEVRASLVLLDHLVRRDNFWDDILQALRDPDVNQGHIANMLEEDLQKLRQESAASDAVNPVQCSSPLQESSDLEEDGPKLPEVDALRHKKPNGTPGYHHRMPSVELKTPPAANVTNVFNMSNCSGVTIGDHSTVGSILPNAVSSDEHRLNPDDFEVVSESASIAEGSPHRDEVTAPQRVLDGGGAEDEETDVLKPVDTSRIEEDETFVLKPFQAGNENRDVPAAAEASVSSRSRGIERGAVTGLAAEAMCDDTLVKKPLYTWGQQHFSLAIDVEEDGIPQQAGSKMQIGGEPATGNRDRTSKPLLDREAIDTMQTAESKAEHTGKKSGGQTEHLTTDDLKNLDLRNYQEELVRLPLKGFNCIVYAPPKSGKTVVAAKVCHDHFFKSLPKIERDRKRPRQNTHPPELEITKCKVMYLVPSRPLLHQIYRRLKEWLPLWKVGKKTGGSNFSKNLKVLLEEHDLLMSTPQILQNALEDGSVSISDLTLLVMDECHHTMENYPYNMIMNAYLKEKHRQNPREGPIEQLPQILGLTATPGAGRSDDRSSILKHLLTLCANLDITHCHGFVKVQVAEHINQMQKHISAPTKESIYAGKRRRDPFSDCVNEVMGIIEEDIDIASDRRDRGTQQYESFITEKLNDHYGNSHIRKSCEHLKLYNRALELVCAVRMVDGLNYIVDEIKELGRRQKHGQLDGTERCLLGLFKEKEDHLAELAQKEQEYPNPKLEELKAFILDKSREECEDDEDGKTKFRGIVFVKMIIFAQAIKEWLTEDHDLATLRPEVLVGKTEGGGSSDSEQKEILEKFNNGTCKILVSTSIGEEGIDIPDCNVSIRYNHVTNEVSMIQSSGRARAEQSKTVLIGDETALAKDRINANRQHQMCIAIDDLGQLRSASFKEDINCRQQALLAKRREKEKRRHEITDSESADNVKLYCKSCGIFACSKGDIKLYNGTHYINASEIFSAKIIRRKLRARHLEKHGVSHSIFCRECDKQWGGTVDCYPLIGLKNFDVKIDGVSKPYKKWKDVPGQVSKFDLCAELAE